MWRNQIRLTDSRIAAIRKQSAKIEIHLELDFYVKKIFLSQLKEGQEATIIAVTAGWRATKRLSDLGMVPQTRVKVLRKAILGPIEIEVRGSRFALGKGLASKVLVTVTK